jgi:hypothetical protein
MLKWSHEGVCLGWISTAFVVFWLLIHVDLSVIARALRGSGMGMVKGITGADNCELRVLVRIVVTCYMCVSVCVVA